MGKDAGNQDKGEKNDARDERRTRRDISDDPQMNRKAKRDVQTGGHNSLNGKQRKWDVGRLFTATEEPHVHDNAPSRDTGGKDYAEQPLCRTHNFRRFPLSYLRFHLGLSGVHRVRREYSFHDIVQVSMPFGALHEENIPRRTFRIQEINRPCTHHRNAGRVQGRIPPWIAPAWIFFLPCLR